ncbi:hypothetical protein EQG49_07100 [Periweissella cryptocerci]|uniref:Uncharacterized protein n=1 Tax=Periweissella cryptocerci TaxID=2506420 RepID=A0A4P6YU46_9LACO|nr:hypothetical protein [Periweissella cryptocerci]QBO36242.1 hypothetical protein EQG49_07100 [Periweissella cryptocerci]
MHLKKLLFTLVALFTIGGTFISTTPAVSASGNTIYVVTTSTHLSVKDHRHHVYWYSYSRLRHAQPRTPKSHIHKFSLAHARAMHWQHSARE